MVRVSKHGSSSLKNSLDDEISFIVNQAYQEKEEIKEQFSEVQHDAKTRHELAGVFVICYFILFLIVLAGVPAYNFLVYARLNEAQELILPLKDILLAYSAIVGPTVGMVIAYYFKSGGK